MRLRRAGGFTLIELMIVVVVIGILAAVAIPNFLQLQARAREAGTKANMHTFQMAAEDYGVRNDGTFASDAIDVVPLMPGGDGNFKNTFSGLSGTGNAWEDRGVYTADCSPVPGITSYADSGQRTYNVKGYGQIKAVTITLTSGQ